MKEQDSIKSRSRSSCPWLCFWFYFKILLRFFGRVEPIQENRICTLQPLAHDHRFSRAVRSAEGYTYPISARIFYIKQKSVCSFSHKFLTFCWKKDNCVLAIGFCCFLDVPFPLTGNEYPSEQRPDSLSWVGCWCTTRGVFTVMRGGQFQGPDEGPAIFLLG